MTPKPADAEISEFVARCGTMIERIERLDDWARKVVRANVVTMDTRTLRASARRVRRGRGHLDRNERFDAMLESMGLRQVFRPG